MAIAALIRPMTEEDIPAVAALLDARRALMRCDGVTWCRGGSLWIGSYGGVTRLKSPGR
jgi:hypothetical protein